MDLLDILGKIGFDWRMAIANLVNFLIIFWLLKRYAFGPVRRIVQERKEKIQQGLDDAHRASSELMMAKQKYEETVHEARKEAQRIVRTAHQQAEKMMEKTTTDSEQKVKKMLHDARLTIEKERTRMHQDLTENTTAIALNIAQKVLSREIDAATDAHYIKKLLKESS